LRHEPEPRTPTDIAEAREHAAVEVFSTMLGIDASASQTNVGRVAPGSQSGIIALFGLMGARSGSGQFSCDPAFWVPHRFPDAYGGIRKSGWRGLDAIAEIATMIVGNVKNLLEAKPGPTGPGTPTIVFGREFDKRLAGNPDRVSVQFACGDGIASVKVILAPGRIRFTGKEHLRPAKWRWQSNATAKEKTAL